MRLKGRVRITDCPVYTRLLDWKCNTEQYHRANPHGHQRHPSPARRLVVHDNRLRNGCDKDGNPHHDAGGRCYFVINAACALIRYDHIYCENEDDDARPSHHTSLALGDEDRLAEVAIPPLLLLLLAARNVMRR